MTHELNIPKQLRDLSIGWLVTKHDKQPFSPVDGSPKWQSPEKAVTFDKAQEAVNSGKYQRLGFVVRKDSGIVVVDFDKVLSEHRNLDSIGAEAAEILDEVSTSRECYIEFSPSGYGLHVYLIGKLPDCMSNGIPQWELPSGGQVEFFANSTKFVIVTGDRAAGDDTIDGTQHVNSGLVRLSNKYGKKPVNVAEKAAQAATQAAQTAAGKSDANDRAQSYFDSFTAGEGQRNQTLYNAVCKTRGFGADEQVIRDSAFAWGKRCGLGDQEIQATIDSGFKADPHTENLEREPSEPIIAPLLTPEPYVPPADEPAAQVDPSRRPANPFIADAQSPMISAVLELDRTADGKPGLLSRIYNHENFVDDIPCPAMRFGAAMYILSAVVGHQILYDKRFFSSLSIFVSAESGRGKSAAKNPTETIIRKLLPHNQKAYNVNMLATDASLHLSAASHSNGFNYQDEGSKIFRRLMEPSAHNTETLGTFCDLTDCQTGLKHRGGTVSGTSDGTTAPAVSPAITTVITIQPGLLDGKVSEEFYTSGAAGRFSVGLIHSGKVKETKGFEMSIGGGTGLGSHVATDYAKELSTPWLQDEWLTSCSYWQPPGKQERSGDSNVAGRLLQFFGIDKKEFDAEQQSLEPGQFYFSDKIVGLFQQVCWRELGSARDASDDDHSDAEGEQEREFVMPDVEQPIRINDEEVFPSQITFEHIVELYCSYNPSSDFAQAHWLAGALHGATATASDEDALLGALQDELQMEIKRSDLTEKFITEIANRFEDDDREAVRTALEHTARQCDPRKPTTVDGAKSLLSTNIGDWSKHGCEVASMESLLFALSEGQEASLVDLVEVRKGKPPIVHQHALTLPVLFRFVELSLMLSGDELASLALPDIARKMLPTMPLRAAKFGELGQLWVEHELHGDESAAKMTPRTQTTETPSAAELRNHTERLAASASTITESSMAERNTASVCKLANLLAASRCTVSRNEVRLHFDDCLKPAQMISDVCRSVLTEQGSIGSRLSANHGMTEDAKTLKRISERLAKMLKASTANRADFFSTKVVADPEFIPEPDQWIVLNKNEFVKHVLSARAADARRAATAQLYDCVSSNPTYLRLCKYERASSDETKVWPARDSREANGFLVAKALYEQPK